MQITWADQQNKQTAHVKVNKFIEADISISIMDEKNPAPGPWRLIVDLFAFDPNMNQVPVVPMSIKLNQAGLDVFPITEGHPMYEYHGECVAHINEKCPSKRDARIFAEIFLLDLNAYLEAA